MISIYSPGGTKLIQNQGAGRHMSVSLTGYSSGMYIFRAITDSGTTISGTFVVAK